MPALLLLEDDLLTATVLRDGLTALGWTVRIETDGLEALRTIQAHPPDAVIADLVLPGLDGLAVCAQIRLQPHGATLPIIATSARIDAEPAARGAGADGFLSKPLSAVTVHQLLTELISRRGATPTPHVPEQVAVPPEQESGQVAPGYLPPLLRRLWREHFTGALDVHSPDGLAVRIYLQQGYPAAARSSDRGTTFGEVLTSMGLADHEHVDAVFEGERAGAQTLGEALVQSGVIDRGGVERALREQVLLRVLGAGAATGGTWRLIAANTLGFAGFDIHPIAIEWRLGGVSETLPGTGFRSARATAPTVGAELWEHLDPKHTLTRLRAMLSAGTQMGELLAEGPDAERLLGLMFVYGLLRLTVDATGSVDDDPRQDALAAIVAEHRLLADASHYAVLGLGPAASDSQVHAAVQAATATLQRASDGAHDGVTRQRIREIEARLHDAARVLGDQPRRAIYDARIDGLKLHAVPRELGPDTLPEELAEYGRHLLAYDRPVAALAPLSRALATADEDDPDVLALLGRARARACPEDCTAGEDVLRRALRVDPACELALLYLGELLSARSGGADEARRCFRLALQGNPECSGASRGLRILDAISAGPVPPRPDT